MMEYDNRLKIQNLIIEGIRNNSPVLSNKPWGNVDKTELLKAVIDNPSLAKKVYLKIEPNWKENPLERLKYPIADKNGTIYRYALSTALTYAKANHETDVISKVKKLYKKYGRTP